MLRNAKFTLRGRIVLAFGFSGFLVGVIFATGVNFVYEAVERDLLIDMLEREVQLAATGEQPVVTSSVIEIAHYRDDEAAWRTLPARWRELGPGFLELDDEPADEIYVLVREIDGVRHLVVFQDESIDRRDDLLELVLVAGVMLVTYASIWLGFVISKQLVSPVRLLADEVRQLPGSGTHEVDLAHYADDEVGELARAFHEYQQQLRRFLERERAFTGAVSHELRTPLTVIGNNVDVLLADESLHARQRERLQRVRRAVNESGNLVGSFLELARGRERPEGLCNPRHVARALVADIEDQFGARLAVRIADDVPETLPVSPAVLTVVLRNLVNNAIEHGEAPVRLDMTAARITVSDAGRPASVEIGPGRLGLAIVTRLCEQLGWRLSLLTDATGTTATIAFSG